MRRKHGSTSGLDFTLEFYGQATYAAGYITRYVEDFAQHAEIPSAIFAERVAAILHGEWSGHKHRMPTLRPASTKGSAAMGEVEVAKRPRNAVQGIRKKRRKVSAAGRKRISEARRAWWAAKKAA